MTKKLISGLILARLAHIWMLNIVASYHVQFQGKRMIQTQENSEKNSFWTSFRSVGPKFKPPFFFSPKLVVRHCSKLSSYVIWRKNNEPDLGKRQKKKLISAQFWPVWPKFGPQNSFPWVLPLVGVRHCRKLSLYPIPRKNYDPNSRKWRKTSFWVWLRLIEPKFGP